MKATIRDVAREAGVAVCTVSFAMNGSAHVAPKTMQRIMEAVEKLNYRPNQSARGLVTKKTDNIGLAVSTTANQAEKELLMDVISGLGQVAGERNYDLILSFQKSQESKAFDHLLDVYRKQSADGIIMMGNVKSDKPYQELIDRRFPFVLLGRPRDQTCHVVNADNEQGAMLAVEHLVKRGHRRIAFITPCAIDIDPSYDRLSGYLKGLAEAGIQADEQLIVHGSFDPDCGYAEAERLLNMEHRPTAILAGRDTIAALVIEKAREMGFSVPGDLAVVGFDNSVLAQVSRPAITSVELPMKQMGIDSAQLLIRLIEGEVAYDDIQTIAIPCQLVVRESS